MCVQRLSFIELLALGPVYPQVLIILFSIICHNGWFSHRWSQIIEYTCKLKNFILIDVVTGNKLNILKVVSLLHKLSDNCHNDNNNS